MGMGREHCLKATIGLDRPPVRGFVMPITYSFASLCHGSFASRQDFFGVDVCEELRKITKNGLLLFSIQEGANNKQQIKER
ncbi:MAG: hypothetical protein ACWA5X_12655 [bacterium]